jgi:hypothetical protein
MRASLPAWRQTTCSISSGAEAQTPRQILQPPDGVPVRSARRPARLDCVVHHRELALGGRPAAGFAKRLILPVSNDTLLRVVRRRSRVPSYPLKVIGIDD